MNKLPVICDWVRKPLTAIDECGQIGWDQFDQLNHVSIDRDGNRCMTGIADVRGKTCPLCDKEWEITTKGFVDQFYHNSRGKLFHKSCYINHIALKEYMLIYNAIVSARLRFEKPEESKNGYGGAWNTPWYKVRLLDFDAIITFGRRKRVDHVGLDCSVSLNPEVVDELEQLCQDRNVTFSRTADGFFAHAWSNDQVKEYVKFMARALGQEKLEPA